jgi:hypothetical protein
MDIDRRTRLVDAAEAARLAWAEQKDYDRVVGMILGAA